jgi:hypothetical protein
VQEATTEHRHPIILQLCEPVAEILLPLAVLQDLQRVEADAQRDPIVASVRAIVQVSVADIIPPVVVGLDSAVQDEAD